MTQSQPSHTEGAPAAAPLSAGTLFYLWADRVLPPSGALGGHVLLSDVRVSARDLAPLLFAVSFARLQGDGVLHLEVTTTTKSFGRTKQRVQVSPAAQPGHRAGFEHAIVERVMAGATTTSEVVIGWFPCDVLQPEEEVFALAKQEMLQCGLGYVDDNARKGVKSLLLGKARVAPLPDRINETWGQFQQFHAWWESYRRHDPALAELLLDTCRRAIRARQDRDTGHDF